VTISLPADARAGRLRLLAAGLGPSAVRVPLAIAQFVAFALAARQFGDVAFGFLVLSQTAARLSTAISIRGGGPMMLRYFATADSASALKELRRELRASLRTAPALGIAIGVAVGRIYALTPGATIVVCLALGLLVCLGNVVRLGSEAAKGAGHPILSMFLEFVPVPLFLLAVVGVGAERGLDGPELLAVLCAAQVLSAMGLYRLLARRSVEGHGATVDAEPSKRLHLSISTIVTLSLPLLGLGAAALVGGAEAVGHLGACLRLLAPSTILISGVSAALLPRVVRDEGNQQSALGMSWGLVALLSTPYSVALIAFPSAVEFIYGPDFADLATVIRIVAAAQLINGITGIAVEVLQVSGHAQIDSQAIVVALVVAVGGALVLREALDMTGAVVGAFVFALVLMVRSVRAGLFVYAPLLQGTRREALC